MRERAKGDKVRAASHAPRSQKRIGVGGEGCAGAGVSSHSGSWCGMGRSDRIWESWESGMNPRALG